MGRKPNALEDGSKENIQWAGSHLPLKANPGIIHVLLVKVNPGFVIYRLLHRLLLWLLLIVIIVDVYASYTCILHRTMRYTVIGMRSY